MRWLSYNILRRDEYHGCCLAVYHGGALSDGKGKDLPVFRWLAPPPILRTGLAFFMGGEFGTCLLFYGGGMISKFIYLAVTQKAPVQENLHRCFYEVVYPSRLCLAAAAGTETGKCKQAQCGGGGLGDS